MKLIYCIFLCLLCTSCDKDDDTRPPLEQLPEATQIGAQTLGCLINGEPFVDTPNAFYQLNGGDYTLSISSQTGNGDNFRALRIGCSDRELISETMFSLIEQDSGNYSANLKLSADDGIGIKILTTTQDLPGNLTITHFDPENFILSGTFEYTVFDEDGTSYEITDGRFDLGYTN